MYGKAIYDFVKVIEAQEFQGEYWLQTEGGRDYAEYAAMPTVIEFQGQLYGKMSFNSDTGRVAYKVGAPVAKIVKGGK
jgi:hypothetical protein